MEPSAGERQIPGWVYKLFTGHAYPYVRRQAKFAKEVKPGEDRPEPTAEEIKAKFWEVYPHCWVKVLQEIKTGMIVSFIELLGVALSGLLRSLEIALESVRGSGPKAGAFRLCRAGRRRISDSLAGV